jgi:DNA-binding PadR family transcriptional regulator
LGSGKPSIRVTPAFFYLLLTLTDGERHGYAMAQEARERSGGSVNLGPGSLYWSLGRLADAGLISETDAPSGETDERRRFYQLTRSGRQVLAREAETLERAVAFARARGIV